VEHVDKQAPLTAHDYPRSVNFLLSAIKKSASLKIGSKFSEDDKVNSETTFTRDSDAHAKQIAMTKKLAVITLALYLARIGNLFSFLYQILSGSFLNYTWDSFLGVFHFCHCIFNPLIILTMDSRWKFRWTSMRSSSTGSS
ncbi:hypothetical protein BKA69DRAFT_1079281, partial [Paraphysoderma sedebokerense]